MDDAEERAAGRGRRPARGGEELAVDERGDEAGPQEARDDEASREHADREELAGERRGRLGTGREQLVGLDRDERRERGDAGDRHGRVVPLGRRVKTLRGDLEAHEHEDRQDRRAGNRLIEIGKRPCQPGESDEGGGGERVGRSAPHRLVGGMADVGRRLDHAPAHAGHERGDRLGRDHAARIVFIARRGRAFGAVDAPHDGAECKRNHDRQIAEHVGPGLEPLEPEGREPLAWPECGSRIDRGVGLVRRDPSAPRADRVHRPTGSEGRERSGNAAGEGDAGRERGERDPEGEHADER